MTAQRRTHITRALIALMLLITLTVVGRVEGVPHIQRCTEDMTCWDCHTMGNRQCGRGEP